MKNLTRLCLSMCLMVVFLSGCMAKVDGYEINLAYDYCQSRRGVDYYSGAGYVRCNDGTETHMSTVRAAVIPKEN